MIKAEDFNLKYTIESGQPLTFYSNLASKGDTESLNYITDVGQIALKYNRTSGRINYKFSGGYDRLSAGKEISLRFGLDQDMKEIYKRIGTDKFMDDAINALYGMRITRNEPWEASLCFVISQFNNIKRIRKIILALIGRFGEEYEPGKKLFPTPEALAAAHLADIRACGTGFRDRYLKHVAEQFSSGFDPERLYRMKYLDAKERLMELDGIGDKVADCVLLFGYNKFEAFPIDVWVKRVMERAYFNGRKRSIRQLHEFSYELWGEYRGYAQQYIFESGRRNKMR